MGQKEPVEHWTAKLRAALALRVLKGETSVADAIRQLRLTVAAVEGCPKLFLPSVENVLRTRPKEEDVLTDE